MAFWTHLLRCSDGSFYTGHTDALEHRIGQHQSGQIPGYTQTRRPVTLVWSQDFPSRLEALEAERQIKGQAQGERNWRAMSPVPFALSLSEGLHYPRTTND
jgi:predicted GIY-YIG superfamily endonuclease